MDRRPPLIARALLRLIPLGQRRAEVEADLLELFRARASAQGHRRAAWRYVHDVLSVTTSPREAGSQVPAYAMGSRPLEGLTRDALYAARMFARQPITIGITILGLGLAIGVSGSVFTLMNAALLRSDGVPDSTRAPRVLRTTPNGVATAWAYNEYQRLHDAATQSRVEAWITDSASYTLATVPPEDPPSIRVAFVTAGYMSALGARAAYGRVLLEGDAALSAPPAVVVSHAYWRRHLGADPAIVGRTLRVGRLAATVVGVAHRTFAAPFNDGPGIWMPLSTYHLVFDGAPVTDSAHVSVVARVPRDVPVASAEAELTAIAAGFSVSADPADRAGATFDEQRRMGRPATAERLAAMLGVMIVISLVLLLACVNVANVLLANATARHREIAVRLALGATRGRIRRQLLTESVMISLTAAGVGLLLTIWIGPVLAQLSRAPSTLDLSPDLPVFLFFAAVVFACGVGAGLAPSRVGARGDLVSPLKGSGAAAPAPPRRLRSSLLGVQAAASVLLLVLATLFVRATVRAARVEVGFDADRLVAASVGFGRSAVASRAKAYWSAALDNVSAIPGVEKTALAQHPPFGGASQVMIAQQPDGTRTVTYFNRTSADYFAVVGLQLVRGRTYTEEEAAANAPVFVISETMARRYWLDRDPIGGTLDLVSGDRGTVIGIVKDTIVARLHEGVQATLYRPLPPSEMGTARLVVRSQGSPAALGRPIRDALRRVDPYFDVRTSLIRDGLDEEVSQPRIVALVSGAMAVLAVVLAAIGLYGVTVALVGQRVREIGVRMALGAERLDVVGLFLRESLRPVFVGLTIGVVLALLGARAIAAILFGVSPHDPLAFGLAVTILLASAVTAVLVPTRNAARVDPASVLRQE